MRRETLLQSSLLSLVLLACGQSNSSSAPSASAPIASAPAASASAPAVEPAETLSASPSASVATAPKCPEVAQVERVASFDWAKEFGVAPDIATKLHVTLGLAGETRALANEIENELLPACASLAAALGGKTGQPHADVACQAAADAVRTYRAKLGAAKVSLNIHAPVCAMPIEVVSECAGHCGDAKGTVTCEGGSIGHCADDCNGTCELRAPSQCEGTCDGKCAAFTGACSGTCKGKCNGAEMKAGTCSGKCEGACEGVGRGTCKGACMGGCQGKTKACAGSCLGACSGTMADAACGSVAKPEGATAECVDYCETRGTRKTPCTVAIVNVTVDKPKDQAAATAFEQAIERNLGAILKVERHLRNRVDMMQRNGDVVTNGLKAITGGDSAKVSACLVGAEKNVTEGVATIKADYAAAKNVLDVVGAK